MVPATGVDGPRSAVRGYDQKDSEGSLADAVFDLRRGGVRRPSTFLRTRMSPGWRYRCWAVGRHPNGGPERGEYRADRSRSGTAHELGVVALAASISTIAVAASVISTGLIADRIGRRKALVAALVGALGDAMVALAPSTSIYLAGRVIAGVGLGAVYGAAFAFIRAVTPPARVPGAVGVFSAALGGAGVLVFTYLGGVMTAIDWRLGFLTITLMSLLCVPLVLPAAAHAGSD